MKDAIPIPIVDEEGDMAVFTDMDEAMDYANSHPFSSQGSPLYIDLIEKWIDDGY